MTTPEWPSNLNYYAERGSFKLSPGQPQLRSEFDYGPARMRQRFTKRVKEFNFSVVFDEDAFAQFEGFCEVTLNGGVSWFNMPVYLGRAGYEVQRVRFVEPYSVSDSGFRHVRVSVKMETIGSVIVDGALSYFLGEYGEEALNAIADPLDVLINEDYPNVMENY